MSEVKRALCLSLSVLPAAGWCEPRDVPVKPLGWCARTLAANGLDSVPAAPHGSHSMSKAP